MTDLDSVLAVAAELLESAAVPYMLIGGLAVAAWGEARATLDVDLTVWADASEQAAVVNLLCTRLQARTADPLGFVEATSVLPLQSPSGVRVDVVFGRIPLQREAVTRAVRKQLASRTIPVASVEDLILMKLISERQKDLDDAHALLKRFSRTLDRSYLAPKLEELAESLSRPNILRIFRESLETLS